MTALERVDGALDGEGLVAFGEGDVLGGPAQEVGEVGGEDFLRGLRDARAEGVEDLPVWRGAGGLGGGRYDLERMVAGLFVVRRMCCLRVVFVVRAGVALVGKPFGWFL